MSDVKDINDLGNELGIDEARNRLLRKLSQLREEDKVNTESRIGIIPSDKLYALFPEENEIIVDGFIRRGEVFNIVSASKAKKSWFREHFALCVAFNLPFLNMNTRLRNGRVLVIDNELHGGTLKFRQELIAKELGIDPAKIGNKVCYMPLRGRLLSLEDICHDLATNIKRDQFDVIFIDSLYRAIPRGFKENDNADMTQLYNWLDGIALQLDCAVGVIHHTTKGDQGGKRVTDRGSGAGAISRAPDTHLTLVEHEESDCMIVEGPTRTFGDIDPFVIKWDFPCWHIAEDKFIEYKSPEGETKGGPATSGGGRRSDLPTWEQNSEGSMDDRARKFCEMFISDKQPTIIREIKDNSSKQGFSQLRFRDYLGQAKNNGWLEETGSNKKGNRAYKFLSGLSGFVKEDTAPEAEEKELPPSRTDSAEVRNLWAESPVEEKSTEKSVLPTRLKRKKKVI